jgi:two-component system, LytTR family, sensor kinase
MLLWLYKNKIRILLNILAWGFLLQGAYNNSQNYHPPHSMKSAFMVHTIGYNMLFVLVSSLNTMWLMPRFFIRKKYLIYLLAFTLVLFSFSILISSYNYWILHHFPGIEDGYFSAISIGMKGSGIGWVDYYLSVIPSVFLVMFLFSIGFLTQQYFQIKKQQDAIRKQQVEAELNLLKSQINPHFLFNVLNSIYSLSLKKSDKAPEIVLKLSDILRYMLYETKQERVALIKELNMIRHYIDIERIRIDSQQQITLKVTGDVQSYVIAPALLIPFVENAVKHGIDSISERAYVNISVEINNGVLHFNCVNNFKEVKSKTVGGIGLENVQKQLQLIYPQEHNLSIETKNGVFMVSLNLKLN